MELEAPSPTRVTETTKTETIATGPKIQGQESQVGGITIRGWIAVILLSTVCAMSVMGKPVVEPLYSAAMLALGFYFGQKNAK